MVEADDEVGVVGVGGVGDDVGADDVVGGGLARISVNTSLSSSLASTSHTFR